MNKLNVLMQGLVKLISIEWKNLWK